MSGLRTRVLPFFKRQRSWTSCPSGCFISDSRGKNSQEIVAIFSRGFRTLGRKHRALLDSRGRDRWLIHGNQSIDVTFFFSRILLPGGNMTRRFVFFTLVAGLLALSLGSVDARAGQIVLPTTLDMLLPASGPPPGGLYATVGTTSPVIELYNFEYTASAMGGATVPLAS